MGRSILPLVVAVAVLCAAAREARASGEMTVTRGEGAEACPDAAELRRIASASHSAPSTSHVYRVDFARTDAGFRAEITDETTKRARTLIDHGAQCAPLGEASAMVLATMWSSEGAEATPPEPIAEAAHPPPPETRHEEVPAASQPPRTHWIGGAGFGLATGLVRTVAPVLVADVTFERSPFAVALGANWIPSQSLPLAPGVVHVQLVAANVRGCGFVGRETHPMRLGVCARLFAGALDARGAGYDVDAHQTRPWLAAGAEFFIGGALPATKVGYRLSLEAVVPIHAEAFSIAGVGTAYETPSVGGLFTLSIEIGTP